MGISHGVHGSRVFYIHIYKIVFPLSSITHFWTPAPNISSCLAVSCISNLHKYSGRYSGFYIYIHMIYQEHCISHISISCCIEKQGGIQEILNIISNGYLKLIPFCRRFTILLSLIISYVFCMDQEALHKIFTAHVHMFLQPSNLCSRPSRSPRHIHPCSKFTPYMHLDETENIDYFDVDVADMCGWSIRSSNFLCGFASHLR
jgi:hypothetical protein